jgi:cellobiose phosphorylase
VRRLPSGHGREGQQVRYGYFDDENREYVITNPRTSVKWINYVGTLDFGGIVDHTGGALICKGDPALNRITRYIHQLSDGEFKGETLYLRFRGKDGYKVFSPYYVPTLHPYELYECHVGLGYSRIVSQFYGIRTETRIFVPLGQSCVVRDIQITNLSAQPLAIDAIPVVEYSHPDALMQFTNADWLPQTMQSRAHREKEGLVILAQYPFMYRETQVNTFTSNRPVSSFETERRRFLGDNGYGTWASPLSLNEEELGNYEAQRGDNIAALLHHLGSIEPGESTRVITQLGQGKSVEDSLATIQRFREVEQVERVWEELAEYWDAYLSRLQVQTPDANVNRLLNIHNPRQCHTTMSWSRYLSLYQVGMGARGMGFRDSAQDVMGVLVSLPEEGRRLIEQLLQVQKRGGSAMYQFNPLTMVANEGDSREVEEAPKYYSDDHLWIVLAIAAYLKETGDLGFLDSVLSYYEKGREGHPLESGTVLDHMRRALAFTKRDVGGHGLPLLGFADWNDTVNLRAGAESLLAANLYGKALLEMMELARCLGQSELVGQYTADYDGMKQAVNEFAWDGEWYVAYFDADGQPVGSHSNSAGQIYATGQSWPVISGFAPPGRAERALEAVHRLLNTRYGIKLNTPAFDGHDPAKGGITTYPPGAKENGGIFLHANPWVIIAETILGHGDRAFEYYSEINPANKNDLIEQYECEPYVYAQNILGDEHPLFGTARNSWVTGTASWAYQAATQYILGIRPIYEGLLIDPCIPSAWEGFGVTREFRKAVYRIEVKNPRHVSRGASSVKVDGQEIEGNVVPAFQDGGTHRVEATM